MFIIGDIIARYSRMKGKKVFFPIASHYSGNTANHVSETFGNIFKNIRKIGEKEKKMLHLYKHTYSTPTSVLRNFTNPLNILDFYNQEILWELKSLDVSGNYEFSYTTKHKDFSVFINTLMSLYKKNRLIIHKKNDELALNYDDKEWKRKAVQLLDRSEFIQPFHKNNIVSVFKNKNIRSDWNLLRKDGFGVIYEKKWIIDPMFDSELFTIFDLYIKFEKKLKREPKKTRYIFKNLFDILQNKKVPKNNLEKKITQWLPCDLFICEEHLKNWLVKKLYAESALLDKKYQTKKYFVLGMGLLNGKRMSASKGNAILARDLINHYGPVKARLIILMHGGHPSKTYNYNHYVANEIDKLLDNFNCFYTHLLTLAEKKGSNDDNKNERIPVQKICISIEKSIEDGYFRQALIELFSMIPKKYGNAKSAKSARELIKIYKNYLEILTPSLLKGFHTN